MWGGAWQVEEPGGGQGPGVGKPAGHEAVEKVSTGANLNFILNATWSRVRSAELRSPGLCSDTQHQARADAMPSSG